MPPANSKLEVPRSGADSEWLKRRLAREPNGRAVSKNQSMSAGDRSSADLRYYEPVSRHLVKDGMPTRMFDLFLRDVKVLKIMDGLLQSGRNEEVPARWQASHPKFKGGALARHAMNVIAGGHGQFIKIRVFITSTCARHSRDPRSMPAETLALRKIHGKQNRMNR
jgi:hypothetical protein